MSPQQPRRPSSSRVGAPRPRKIAGRESEPVESRTVDAPQPQRPAPSSYRTTPTTGGSSARSRPVDLTNGGRGGASQPAPPKPSMFAGAGLTRVLLISLAVLVVLLLLQGGWFLRHALREPQSPPKHADGAISVPSGRPIVLNQTDVDAGVDAAAKDVVVIFSRDYKTYDEGVAKAVDLMTDGFAKQFKESAAATKPKFVSTKTNVSGKVVYQGAIAANTTQVQALLFFNQYVTKGTGKNARITYTPFKMAVTMVHTDHGWLVQDLDTK